MAKQITKSYKTKKRIKNVIVHAFLAVLAAVWLLPIFWVILTSFRADPGSYVDTFFPKSYTLDNYVKLFTEKTALLPLDLPGCGPLMPLGYGTVLPGAESGGRTLPRFRRTNYPGNRKDVLPGLRG